MKSMTCNLPDSLYKSLQKCVQTEKASKDHVISMALAQYFSKPLHTLFQVSTSAALVEGLYEGAVRVSRLLQHGDFGIGTFIDLDGEMVVLDGICYRISSSGVVAVSEGNKCIPYAVVTRFTAQFARQLRRLDSFRGLMSVCDKFRDSENVFYAFRVEGHFSLMKTRVMKAVPEGTTLKAAAFRQKQFGFQNVSGTLVGLWSPGFAGSFSVPGYHFHFLSADRKQGGHVLECRATGLEISGCAMHEMHVSLPETAEFLKADLSRDPRADLMSAERNHQT